MKWSGCGLPKKADTVSKMARHNVFVKLTFGAYVFLNQFINHQDYRVHRLSKMLCTDPPQTSPISHRHESQLPKHVGYAQWIYLRSRDFRPVHRYFDHRNAKSFAEINNFDIETPSAERAQQSQFPEQHIKIYKTPLLYYMVINDVLQQ